MPHVKFWMKKRLNGKGLVHLILYVTSGAGINSDMLGGTFD